MKSIITIMSLVAIVLTNIEFCRADADDVEAYPGLTLQRRLKKVLAVSYLAGSKALSSEAARKRYPNCITYSEIRFTTVACSNDTENCFVYIENDTLDIDAKSHCVTKRKN